MRALGIPDVLTKWDTTTGYDVLNVSEPTLDEGSNPDDASSVLLEMIAAGFCGTDKTIWFRRGLGRAIKTSVEQEKVNSRIAGHELLGRIVGLGSVAKARSGLKLGDIVSSESHVYCGHCYQCRIGEYHVCANEKILGISASGCFAQVMKIPYWTLWPTDLGKIRREVAAIQEPFGNAVHACSKVDLRGQSVAVLGCGTIGLMSILVARALGAAKIYGIDISQRNLELASQLGADDTILVEPADGYASDDALHAQILDATDGVGVDVAMEMSGAKSGVNNAIRLSRRGGHIVLFGLSGGPFTIEDYEALIMNGKSLHSVIGREVFRTWQTTKNLLESQQNGIQDKVYDIILNKGRETIVDFDKFERTSFEAKLQDHPKFVISMQS